MAGGRRQHRAGCAILDADSACTMFWLSHQWLILPRARMLASELSRWAILTAPDVPYSYAHEAPCRLQQQLPHRKPISMPHPRSVCCRTVQRRFFAVTLTPHVVLRSPASMTASSTTRCVVHLFVNGCSKVWWAACPPKLVQLAASSDADMLSLAALNKIIFQGLLISLHHQL